MKIKKFNDLSELDKKIIEKDSEIPELKKIKSNHKYLKIGDYVLAKDKYLRDTIGQLIDKISTGDGYSVYAVKYEKIPKFPKNVFIRFDNNTLEFYREEIEHFSENIEELEDIINSRKYNL
jgi:hypothetical protein